MIRNSIALEKHYGICEDLDSIIVRWNYDTPWVELLEKGAQAFKNLYRMNYELWRKKSVIKGFLFFHCGTLKQLTKKIKIIN